jgi:hypothetical protein
MTAVRPHGVVMLAVTFATMVLAAAAASQNGSLAQHVWQSDVSVRALELTMTKRGDPITTRIVVAADLDDAQAVQLEILLPVGVGLVSMPKGCRASPSPVISLNARVTCALGDVSVGQAREVSITTTGAPASRGLLRFAAFAISNTPDPWPANNFADRAVP